MANYIKREIQVTSYKIPIKIPYVQYSNALTVWIELTDYTIPSGATATVYVKKPSGAEVYDTATISGNTVIVYPTTQMVAEVGEQVMQVQIISSGTNLVTFPIILDVVENVISESAVESTDEFDALTEATADAKSATTACKSATTSCKTATTKATTATTNANTATTNANAATSAANTAASSADTAATAATAAAARANEAASKAEVFAGDFADLEELYVPSDGDAFVFSDDDDDSQARKITITNMADWMLSSCSLSDLNTSYKTITLAINELEEELTSKIAYVDSTLDNLSINSGSVVFKDFAMSKTGYTCIGVIMVQLVNGSTNGTGSSGCSCTGFYTISNGVHVNIRNHGTGTAIIKVTVRGLFVKN